MRVLGIESSCDETGIAVYDTESGLLGDALHSQIARHAEYGGVVPELASRDHIRHIIPLLKAAFAQANTTWDDIDGIAYTRGPGLAGALLVGASVAAGLALARNLPVLGVHHLEGHLLSPLLSKNPPQFPFVALLVSGGNTQLMRVDSVGKYTLLGETLDDAAGEAFDKTAKLLGLGYPGGPQIAELAAKGNSGVFNFPRPLLHSGDLNFSFSGLKTAVMTQIRKLPSLDEQSKADLAKAFEEAVCDILASKASNAMRQTGLKRLVVAGGVGANQSLRATLDKKIHRLKGETFYPPLSLCTDNGAMIALTGALRMKEGLWPETSDLSFSVRPRWPLSFAVSEKENH